MKILTLTKRWDHHTASGGYDRLPLYLGADVVKRRSEKDTSFWHLKRALYFRWKAPMHVVDYKFGDLLVEQQAAMKAFTGKYDVVHSLYGDEQLSWLLHHRSWLKARLVATFHLPWYRSKGRFEAQRGLLDATVDHFFAVSADLAQSLADLFGSSRVSYVPHGIDTDIFIPSGQESRAPGPLRLLTVGHHMRDLALIHQVADACHFNGWPVEFTYVGPKPTWSNFTGCRNVQVATGLSEEELIKEYHQCDAVLLPVTGATANNALLEGVACGKPVISTRTGGIPDYLDEKSGWMISPDAADELTTLVHQLSADPMLCRTKEAAARQHAMQFSWPNVAAQFNNVYQRLSSQPQKDARERPA